MCYTLVSKVNDFQCVNCSSSSSSAITLEHIQPPVLHVASFVRQTKIIIEKSKAHILCSVTFFFKMCHLGDNVENMAEQEKPQMPI